MPDIQQSDVVGNYLGSLYQAQDRGMRQVDRQNQMQRQQVQDEQQAQQFDVTNQLNQLNLHKAKIGALNELLSRIPDGNAQAFEAAKQQALQHPELGLKPEDVANLTVADLPRLKMETGQAQAMLDMKLKEAQIEASKANTAQSYAAAEAARALAKQRGVGGAGGIDNTTFDNMSGLRKEFVGATKTYQDVRDAYGRIQASAKDPSAAGDLSLIFNYMKVLDPGSTVREGEFATAQNAAGIPERIVNAYNQAISGQRLNDAQRKDFVNRANSLFQRQHQTYLATKKNYDTLAQRFGFDPSLVTFDQSAGMADPAPAAPVQQAPQSFTGSGVFTNNMTAGGQQQAPAATTYTWQNGKLVPVK